MGLGEVAFVNLIAFALQRATTTEPAMHAPERVLENTADVARLQVTVLAPGELVVHLRPTLVRPIEEHHVQVGVEPQV